MIKQFILAACILAAFFCSLTPCFSQENINHRKENWSIGPNISADICYRKLINKDDSASSQMVIDSRNSYEVPKLGFTIGINFQYALGDHWGLEGGVQFAKRGYRSVFFPFPNNDPSVVMYNHKYLDIPLRLNYISGPGSWQFTGCAGLIPQYFVVENVKQTRSAFHAPNSKTNSTFPYHPLQLSAMGGGGIQRNNGRKVLRLELLGKYGLTNIISTPVTAKLWSIGINFTFFYKFN